MGPAVQAPDGAVKQTLCQCIQYRESEELGAEKGSDEVSLDKEPHVHVLGRLQQLQCNNSVRCLTDSKDLWPASICENRSCCLLCTAVPIQASVFVKS